RQCSDYQNRRRGVAQVKMSRSSHAGGGGADGIGAGGAVGGGRDAGFAIRADGGGASFEGYRSVGGRSGEGDDADRHRLEGIVSGDGHYQRIGEGCGNDGALTVTAGDGEGEALALEGADVGGVHTTLAALVRAASVAAAPRIDSGTTGQ